MINNLTKKLSNHLVEGEIIPEEDKELYEFGIRQGITMILHLLTTMITGLILGLLWQSVILMVCFIPMRIYAGGYHAKTRTGCYFFSTVINFIALCFIKFFTVNFIISILIVISTFICVFFLAPLPCEDKPISTAEIKVYKKVVRYIWLAESVLLLIFYFLKLEQLGMTFLMSFALVSFLLMLGRLSEILRK